MLAHAALLLTQKAEPNPFEAFIAQCSKAVLAIEEGVWRTEISSGDQSQVIETLLKDKRSLFRTSVDGKPYVDLAVLPETMVCVSHDSRQN